MIYVIGQIAIWLFLTAAFAAAAGWAFAAWRAGPARRAMRRDRDRLVHDLAKLAAGEGAAPEPGVDVGESLSRIRESRIAELERALESARSRADDAAGEAAELRRQLERGTGDGEELTRLRALVAEHEERRGREIEAQVLTLTPVTATEEAAEAQDDGALQAWRLRYFEQRVRYLEETARAPGAAPASEPQPELQQIEWRAREAEARAAHLEQELRTLAAAPAQVEAAPFAADAEVDALLRWRLLYLERRVAHLQDQPAAPASAPAPAAAPADTAPDPDRWKWRARYLEARVRHLEQRVPAPVAPAARARASEPRPTPEPAAIPAPRPARAGAKPPVLASARNGAPDDFTLIDGVSLLQQSTLNALGVFHFDQIAAWTPDHVAWIDNYLRLRGRIEDEEWVEQAQELAREGPAAARRAFEDETA